MLDPKILRQDLDAVAANLARRGFKLDRERYVALESERKDLQVKVEGLRQARNERSKAIGRAKAAGGDVEALKREVGQLGDELASSEARLTALAAELDDFQAGCRICCTLPCPKAPIQAPTSKCVAGARHRNSVRATRSRGARRETRAHRLRRSGEALRCTLRGVESCGSRVCIARSFS